MPEITSPDAIRAKLREFDQLLTDAIEAAQVLEQMKADAKQLVASINDKAKSSEALLADIQAIREVFTRFEADTIRLTDHLKGALEECAQAQQLVRQKLEEAERRLFTSVTAALDAQKAALSELDRNTRINAQAADQAKALALDGAAQVARLVASTKASLEDFIKRECLERAQMLGDEVKRMNDHFNNEQKVFRADLTGAQARIVQLERQSQEVQGALEQRIQGAELRLIGLDAYTSTLATRLDKLITQLKSRSFLTGVK